MESDQGDDFDKIYKGEISKSGAAILPSKRARKMPDKIISKHNEEIKKTIDQTDEKVKEDSLAAENKTE